MLSKCNGGAIIRTYGRTTILVPYTEEQIYGDNKNTIIKDIIENYYEPIHEKNYNETLYLQRYIKGRQDVLDKIKETRENINHKIVENWALANIEFKTALLLGKPIKYVNANDEANEEISQLNNYVKYEYKNTKDKEIYTDILVGGRGFRYNNKDSKYEEDEAPFEIINCNVLNTECIYSAELGNPQLFTIIDSIKKISLPNGDKKEYIQYDIYDKKEHNIVIKSDNQYSFDDVATPLLYNEHLITEWYVNRDRLSLIEIGKDLYDTINYIESLDMDDMEQFVNAYMIFTNAEIDETSFDLGKKMGAFQITSTENKKASIELLQARLNSTQTESVYNRIVNTVHQIVGVPIASSNGNMQMGDTGKANLTGQGFMSASIRIQNDENMISMCDMKSMKTIIKICKQSPNSKIKNLNVIDIDNKLQLDNRENLLVKSQSLQSLLQANVPEEYAVPAINLFPDPNAVVMAMKKKINDKLELMKNEANNSDGSQMKVNETMNNVQDTLEIDNQGK